MKVITLGNCTFRTEDVDMIRFEPSCYTIFVRTKAGRENLIFSKQFQDAVQDA